MKTNYWRYVFPEDRHKLRKYFYRDVSEEVYIRVVKTVESGITKYFFEMCGEFVGVCYIRLNKRVTLDNVKKDFPFVKVYEQRIHV